jgi:Icc-related predicted phosphoesterase
LQKEKLKIMCLSDTHSQEDLLKIPKGKLSKCDIIIHCGDMTNIGQMEDVHSFLRWADNLLKEFPNIQKFIFIAGNHDFCFQNEYHDTCIKAIKNINNDIVYLQDDFITINDIKIYGIPWQPFFKNWAFNINEPSDALEEKYLKIPKDTDILVTHCPPYSILDTTIYNRNKHLGSTTLYDTLKRNTNIKLCLSGHIHSGYGTHIEGTKTFINCSVMDEDYRCVNKPIFGVFKKGEIFKIK